MTRPSLTKCAHLDCGVGVAAESNVIRERCDRVVWSAGIMEHDLRAKDPEFAAWEGEVLWERRQSFGISGDRFNVSFNFFLIRYSSLVSPIFCLLTHASSRFCGRLLPAILACHCNSVFSLDLQFERCDIPILDITVQTPFRHGPQKHTAATSKRHIPHIFPRYES